MARGTEVMVQVFGILISAAFAFGCLSYGRQLDAGLAGGTQGAPQARDGQGGFGATDGVADANRPRSSAGPTWQAIGPMALPNGHSCDNVAEAALLGAGKTQAFAIDLANPSVMYAGGGMGQGSSGPFSSGGLHKSSDGGSKWVTAENGLTDSYVDAIWLDQSDASIVVASTWVDGIFRSTNGGKSWTNVRPGSTTYLVQSGGLLLAAAADGIASSADAGATWTLQHSTGAPVRSLGCGAGACYAGLDDGTVLAQAAAGQAWTVVLSSNSTVYGTVDIAVNPGNGQEAVVAFYTVNGPMDLITMNGGASWSAFGLPASQSGPCGSGGPATVLAFDTVNPSTMYADLGGVLWVSGDGGTTWNPLHLYVDLRMIYPLPGQAGKVVVGGDQGIYMSQDGGATWSSLNGDLTTNLLTGVAVSGNEVLTAVQDFSPSLSFDGGKSWLQLSGSNPPVGEDGVALINPGNSQWQYLYNGAGFQYSSNGGQTFTNDSSNLGGSQWGFAAPGTSDHGSPTPNYIAVDPSNAANLYLVGTSGIWKSQDYGVNWQATGWPVPGPTLVVIDPNNANTVFAGSWSAGTGALYVTHDGGATWTTASLPTTSQPPVSLAVDPSDSGVVILSTDGSGAQPVGSLLRSTDGGATFSVYNQGVRLQPAGLPAELYGATVRFAPASVPHVVVAATVDGLYASEAGGAWMDITGNAATRWFTDASWSGGDLYAATYGEGVLKTSVSSITNILQGKTK